MESDEKELKDEEKEHAEEMKEDDDDKAEDENGEGDPFYLCGPPSSVLVKREEERLAREKEKLRLAGEEEKLKSAMEMEGTKLGNLEETAEIKMKEKVMTASYQEEGEGDIIDEGGMGECAPCFKGWVHFCPEDIFAC